MIEIIVVGAIAILLVIGMSNATIEHKRQLNAGWRLWGHRAMLCAARFFLEDEKDDG